MTKISFLMPASTFPRLLARMKYDGFHQRNRTVYLNQIIRRAHRLMRQNNRIFDENLLGIKKQAMKRVDFYVNPETKLLLDEIHENSIFFHRNETMLMLVLSDILQFEREVERA